MVALSVVLNFVQTYRSQIQARRCTVKSPAGNRRGARFDQCSSDFQHTARLTLPVARDDARSTGTPATWRVGRVQNARERRTGIDPERTSWRWRSLRSTYSVTREPVPIAAQDETTNPADISAIEVAQTSPPPTSETPAQTISRRACASPRRTSSRACASPFAREHPRRTPPSGVACRERNSRAG
jgi:hypothetical protein